MKKQNKNVPICRFIIIEIIILAVSYLVVRYPLFKLHGSYDAPNLGLLPAVIGVAATAVIKWPNSFLGTSFGYLLSFAIAQIFQKEYIDPAHGNTLHNNWFEIWIITYSVIVTVSILLDIAEKRKHHREGETR